MIEPRMRWRDVVNERAQRIGFGRSDLFDDESYAVRDSVDGSHHVILEYLQRPPCRVLDLGCSGGLVSAELRKMGHYVVGVDVRRDDQVEARTDEFHVADLDRGLPADVGGDFDVIVAGDVLEHVRRPDALLEELRTVLADRGRAIVSIPNFGHWYPRGRVALGQFDYDERGILDDDHVRFFTRKSFIRLCDRAGWSVVASRTTGVPLDLVSSGRIARAATRVERGARAAWPTMFAYQFVFELVPARRETATTPPLAVVVDWSHQRKEVVQHDE